MTFSYNPNLPNPPNDPADDVPGMQINAGSISSLIAVDHVGFNVAGGGQHNQVTFNANNIPASPTSPPVLFTKDPGGPPLNYPQLFFYSGSAAQSSNQYVLAGSGSTMLLGGIILKWGTYTIPNGSTSASVTFSSAFPNNIFVVTITNTVAITPGDLGYRYTGQTLTQFIATRNGNTGNATYAFIAIGN